MKGLFICSCSGVREKAEAAFKILFPKEEVPNVYRGEAAITKVSHANSGTNLGNYLNAIAKTNGRFAYYVSSDDDGNVVDNYNLLTGKQVA